MLKSLDFLLVLTLAPVVALGSVTLQFEAGVLRDSLGDPLAVDTKAILVSDTSGGGFAGDYLTGLADFGAFDGTSLTIGSQIGSTSTNIILQVFSVFDLTGDGDFGIGATFTFEVDGSPFSTGDSLGLYWFPHITGGTISGNLAEYGFYRTDSVDTASGSSIAFQIPADASVESIGVIDDNLGGGASVSDLTAIPEPRLFGVLAGILALGIAFVRLKRSRA